MCICVQTHRASSSFLLGMGIPPQPMAFRPVRFLYLVLLSLFIYCRVCACCRACHFPEFRFLPASRSHPKHPDSPGLLVRKPPVLISSHARACVVLGQPAPPMSLGVPRPPMPSGTPPLCNTICHLCVVAAPGAPMFASHLQVCAVCVLCVACIVFMVHQCCYVC